MLIGGAIHCWNELSESPVNGLVPVAIEEIFVIIEVGVITLPTRI
jgi:hypothetical protein